MVHFFKPHAKVSVPMYFIFLVSDTFQHLYCFQCVWHVEIELCLTLSYVSTKLNTSLIDTQESQTDSIYH